MSKLIFSSGQLNSYSDANLCTEKNSFKLFFFSRSEHFLCQLLTGGKNRKKFDFLNLEPIGSIVNHTKGRR
jgi:hypothetical protein